MASLIHNSKGRTSVKKRDATFKERLLSRCKQRIKAERKTLIAKMRENVRARWSWFVCVRTSCETTAFVPP